MNFKRLWGYLLIALVSLSLLTGCGSSSKEAKELLTRILKIVGIPYDIVVNICQDGNDNGFCEANELQTKITINKGDSFQTILHKIQLTEDGRYFLENYDPTKKILMELEDNKILNNSGQKVTLPYEPKDIEEVPVQELSILQSLIDNGLLKEEEVKKLRESDVRPKVDAVLLENLFENQTILVEQNMSDVDARDRNLEYIAEGLRDINVSSNLVETLENCENNNSCEEAILVDANEQTQISKKEAVVIAENNSTEGTGDKDTSLTTEENNTTTEENNTTTEDSNTTTSDSNTTEDTEEGSSTPVDKTTQKNVADGYLLKLSSPAKAFCGSTEYTSSLTIGAKGAITFNGVELPNDCHVFIPSGATIDSNNNGQLDSNDTTLAFSMKGLSSGTFISPLTTLLVEKEAAGEDVTTFKAMVNDFDPVVTATKIQNSTGTAKVEQEKLMLLMEILKNTLDGATPQMLQDINLTTVVTTNAGDTIDDLNTTALLSSFSPELKDKANAKAGILKNIIKLFKVIDTDIIDTDTFIICISDGKETLMDAFKHSVKASVSQTLKNEIADATTLDTVVDKIMKSSYNATQRTDIKGYMNSISSNLSSMHSGYFSFSFTNINLEALVSLRSLEFTNLAEIDKVISISNLDELTSDSNYLDYKNYDSRYEKSYTDEDVNSFKIKTNHVSKFEIVDGLDSKFFSISRGNRDIAYIDLKDGINSPTADNPEDVNGDNIYEVEIKATDVQMLESKTILLRFKIIDTTTTTTTTYSPISTQKGYITKFASIGGAVLNRTNDYYGSSDYEKIIEIDSSFELSSLTLEGVGAEDFEIVDNEKIKVANSLDYNAKPLYDLTVVATDNAGNEFNRSLEIEVTNDSNRTLEVNNRDYLESNSSRINLSNNNNYYYDNNIYTINDNPTKFEIMDELDSKFFTINSSGISHYAYLDSNSSFSPTYKIKEDSNGDGIYEVKVKMTDVQTLESSIITVRRKLVSSHFDFNYFDDTYRRDYFNINQETVVGGEVPYSVIKISKVDDVNITNIYLEGEGNEDFNITDNAIVVVNALDASTKNSYSLKLVVEDTTGYRDEQNITIYVEYGATHNAFTITNTDELKTTLYTTDSNYYYYYSNDIHTNNIARMRFNGDDYNTVVDMEHFNYFQNGHDTYFYFYRKYYDYDTRPTYLNPKDKDGDNIYQFQVELTDIETLEKKTIDYSMEMLSHQVVPYNQSETTVTTNSVDVNLSIPKEAPIGGELLTVEGAKGFIVENSRDISFEASTLSGVGADNFEIVGNTIKLKSSLLDSNITNYNLTLGVTDSEGIESTNTLNIEIKSIFD